MIGRSILNVCLFLSACSDDRDPQAPKPATRQQSVQQRQPAIPRGYDSAKRTQGARLFAQNCAVCHRARAEGAPRWTRPGANGKYPPPPLNGTAHAWHHSTTNLKRTTRDGTVTLLGSCPRGVNNCPFEKWKRSLHGFNRCGRMRPSPHFSPGVIARAHIGDA